MTQFVFKNLHGNVLRIAIFATMLTFPANVFASPPVGEVRLPVLSYTINKSGPVDGAHPRGSDSLLANYTLKLLDGRIIDSSASRGKPHSFTLRGVIPAWQVLLQLMRPGDNWTFFVPPEYAYGSRAVSTIPANSFLIFEVELVSIEPKASE